MTSAEKWIERGQYDFETARAMHESRRYLYVLFCCQQAIEKTLKGIIAGQSGVFPPRIHNLIRLAEAAGLELTEESSQLFRELTNYYIQTRYPEELEEFSSGVEESHSQHILELTEEAIRWLLSTK